MSFEEFIKKIKKFDSRYGNQYSWSYGDNGKNGKFAATATGTGIVSCETRSVEIKWDKHFKYFTVTVSGSTSIGRGDTIEDALLDWEHSESFKLR